MALPPPQFVLGQLAEAQRQVDVTRHRMEVFRDAWARLHLYATEAMSTLKRVTRMLEEATANECGHTDESLKRRTEGLTQAKLVLHRELPTLPDVAPPPEYLRQVDYSQALGAMGFAQSPQHQYPGAPQHPTSSPSPHGDRMGGFPPGSGSMGTNSSWQGAGAGDVLNQLIAASVLRPVGSGPSVGGSSAGGGSVGGRGGRGPPSLSGRDSPDQAQFDALNSSARSLPAPSTGYARSTRASTPNLNASWNGSGPASGSSAATGPSSGGSRRASTPSIVGGSGSTAPTHVSRSMVATSAAGPSPTRTTAGAPRSAADKLASLAMSPGSASNDGSGIGAGTPVHPVSTSPSASIGDAAVSADVHQHRRLLSGAPRPSTRNLFCVSCGFTGPVGTKFCGRCGNPSGFVSASSAPQGPAPTPAGIRLARPSGGGSPHSAAGGAVSVAPAPVNQAPQFPPQSSAVAHPDGSIHGVLIQARDRAFVLCTAKVVNHHLRLMPVTPVHGSLVSTGLPEVVLPISFMTRLLRVDCGDAPLPAYVPTEFVFRVHGHDGVGHTLWAPDERSMSLYLRVLADASGQRVDVVPLALALRRASAGGGDGESSSGSSSEEEEDDDDDPSNGAAQRRPPVTRTATTGVCWNCAGALVPGTRFCGRCGMGQSQADVNAAWGGDGGASDPKRIHPSRSETDLEALAQEARDAERKVKKAKKAKKHKKHRGDVSTVGKNTSKVEGYVFKAFVSSAVDVDKGNGKGKGSGKGGAGADEEEVAVESVVWVPDHLAPKCMMDGCNVTFTSFGNRRHHCRLCGKVYCMQHSLHKIKVANVAGVDPNKPQRACDVCYARVAAGGPAVKPATEADIVRRKRLVDPTASHFDTSTTQSLIHRPAAGRGPGPRTAAAAPTAGARAAPDASAPTASGGGGEAAADDGRPRFRPRGMSIFDDIDLAFDDDDTLGRGGGGGGKDDKKRKKKKKKRRSLLQGGADAGGSTAHSSMPIRGDPQYNDFQERVRREQARLAAINARPDGSSGPGSH